VLYYSNRDEVFEEMKIHIRPYLQVQVIFVNEIHQVFAG